MATTYTLISSNTLTSSAASVTFSSIPATYTDLVLRISTRNDRTTSTSTMPLVKFNSITGAISSTYIEANGSSVLSSSTGGNNQLYVAPSPSSTTTSNTFDNQEIYIPNYAGSTNKPISVFGVMENNSATVNYIDSVANLLSNTAAITSITISLSSTFQFVSGSSFYLYGIKNS